MNNLYVRLLKILEQKYVCPHIFYFVNFANCFSKHKNKIVPMTFMAFCCFIIPKNGDKNPSKQCDFSIPMQTVVKNPKRDIKENALAHIFTLSPKTPFSQAFGGLDISSKSCRLAPHIPTMKRTFYIILHFKLP